MSPEKRLIVEHAVHRDAERKFEVMMILEHARVSMVKISSSGASSPNPLAKFIARRLPLQASVRVIQGQGQRRDQRQGRARYLGGSAESCPATSVATLLTLCDPAI